MRAAVLAACAIAACACAACDTAVHDIAHGALDASPSCEEANAHSDLGWIQDNILTKGCALSSSCHKGTATEAAHLSLEPGKTRAQLLGPTGTGAACMADYLDAGVPCTLVQPGETCAPGTPCHSYLLVLLDPASNPVPGGAADPDGGLIGAPLGEKVGSMPYNNPLLCVEKRRAIARWVAAGAPPEIDGGAPVFDAGVPDAP